MAGKKRPPTVRASKKAIPSSGNKKPARSVGDGVSAKSKKAKAKCLVLLSGGLDSRLVCKMLQQQLGAENVEAVFFALPFGGGCCSDRFCVMRFCQTENVRLHVVDCTKGLMFRRYMALVRKPKFRRGVALNPCIDCHLFMLKEARKLAEKAGARFLATGEVLGERPLSQNRPAMDAIEKEAGLAGKVLRPLSAKLLPETEAERKGWVDRSRLENIAGRRRLRQLEMARGFGIDFPTPGGGCLLTDREFSKRLAEFVFSRDFAPQHAELAKLGRHFLMKGAVIIVGRNHQENIKIGALAKELGYPTLEVSGFMGPTTAITAAKPGKTLCKAAALLTARYSDAPKGGKCVVLVRSGKKVEKMAVIAPLDTGSCLKPA
jgi:tRNA U34 2-thiouridine synthase MnmA/TrmU